MRIGLKRVKGFTLYLSKVNFQIRMKNGRTQNRKWNLRREVWPETPLAEGFEYLFALLANLVGAERLFKHKVEALLIISSLTNKASFSKEDLEIVLSQYGKGRIGHLIRGFTNSGWLEFDDGRYRLTAAARKILRIFPVLNMESKRDDEAALDILYSAMDMVDQAQSPLIMKRLLRDQAVQQLLRDEELLKEALTSRNSQVMEEVASLASKHLQDIRILRKRQSELYQEDRDRRKSREVYSIIQRVIDLYRQVTESYKNLLEDSIKTGGRTFTKHDADKFLYKADFTKLEEMLPDGIAFAPVNLQILDPEELLTVSEQFLNLNRTREKVGYGKPEGNVFREESDEPAPVASEMVKRELAEAFERQERIALKKIVPRDSWAETLMFMASLAFLEGENQQLRKDSAPEVDFLLNISTEAMELDHSVVKKLSQGEIVRGKT
ncbi:hypothetical protein [Desulfitobacterium chlororespirans]|nr:hypothetical protein [Desulfitobacterium chlororespirans]